MKKRKYSTATKAPHIGKLLQNYIRKHRIHRGVLAKLLGRSYSTVYKYQKNASTQTHILWELCVAMKHNFLLDLAAQLPADFTTYAPDPTLALQEELENLRDKNKILEAKLEELRHALGKR